MIGFDTCAIIDLFKGDKRLLDLVKNLDEEFCLSQLSYLELVFGTNPKNNNHLIEEGFYDALFEKLRVFDATNFGLKKASRLFWELKAKGNTIGKIDSIIATNFMINGVNKIITKDKKHFSQIKGVKVLNY